MKELGIYVHIPFCKRKCYYCDFCSYERNDEIHKKYKEALISEIRAFNVEYESIVKTVYIGGGTPSIIDENYIAEIVEALKSKFNIDESAEITIEVNPGTANIDKIKKYKELGINRLSLGLQSTEDRLLKLIGRIHTYNEFEEVYEMARNTSFNNINVDLMIGLPTQTLKDVESSLNKMIEKNPEHISVYSLIVEEETKIDKMLKSGEISLPDEEIERAMYWKVKHMLEDNGYIHYEISNFAKKGFESKHNVDCWKQKEYVGFGIAAHSYLNGQRYSNTSDLNIYMNCNDFECIKEIDEIQSKQDKMNEFVMLGLRMIKGIDIAEFEAKFKVRFEETYSEQIQRLINEELVELKDNRFYLSSKGIDFANIVWSEFI